MQSITERNRMLGRPRIIDAVFSLAHRAIRKALQPQDSRKMDAGRNPRVELQRNELPFKAGSNRFCERPFDMASRARLIAKVVVEMPIIRSPTNRSLGSGLVAAKEANRCARDKAVR